MGNYLRLANPVIVFLVAGVGAYGIPFYPLPVGVVVAVASAGLAFMSPSVGLLVALLALAPVYGYQMGVTFGGVWGVIFLGIMMLLAFIASGLARTGFNHFLAATTGALAAYLMPTPLSFAAIVIVLLFTAWYRDAPRWTAILVFLMAYFPILVVNAAPLQTVGDVLPVYSQATGLFPALTEIDLGAIGESIFGFGATAQRRVSIYRSLQNFFVSGYSGWLFITLFIVSVMATYGLSRTIGKVRDQEKGAGLRFGYLNIPVVLAGWMIFLAPLSVMQSSLRYRVSVIDPYLGIAQVALVMVGSMVSMRFTISFERAQELVSLRTSVGTFAEELVIKTDELLKRTENLRSELGIALSEQIVRIKTLEDSLQVIANTYTTLNRKGLEDRKKSLEELQVGLSTLEKEVKRRLSDSYLQLSKEYLYALEKLRELQDSVPSQTTLIDSSKSEDEIFSAFRELREGLAHVAAQMVQRTQELSTIAKTIEPDFSPSIFSIAQEFHLQKEYAKSLQSAIEAIDLTFKKLGPQSSETLTRCQALLKDIIQHVGTDLIPLLEELGDKYLVARVKVMPMLSMDSGEVGPRNSAFDIFTLAKVKEGLPTLLIQLLKEIDGKLLSMEAMIDSLLPLNFSWSKDYDIHADVEKFLADFKVSTQPGMNFVDPSVNAIEIIKRLTKRLDAYVTMHDFARNYKNVERMISAKLFKMGRVELKDLPVRLGKEYLKLYAFLHPDASFDTRKVLLVDVKSR